MEIFSKMQTMEHEQVVFCHDKTVGLKAIIAIHDTTLGPALGGSRMWNYASDDEALNDVLRLSRGMTYKAAVAGLNLGGGKAVILGDAKKLKSEAFFRSFGRFVDSLGGKYITAEDVNITVQDIEHVAKETKFVSGVSRGSGDPSPLTALGVFSGIRAAAKYRLGSDTLRGLRVAIQGVGAVGSHLSRLLNEQGAKLYICDIEKDREKRMRDLYGAIIVPERDIYGLDVDVYAPCALGATLNDETIPQLKAAIVAGGANNQLQDETRHGKMLRERKILYCPDYVINAGGLINVYQELLGYNEEAAHEKARNIYFTCLKIFNMADDEKIETNIASARVAEERLRGFGRVA